jgi:hypothetical protein
MQDETKPSATFFEIAVHIHIFLAARKNLSREKKNCLVIFRKIGTLYFKEVGFEALGHVVQRDKKHDQLR